MPTRAAVLLSLTIAFASATAAPVPAPRKGGSGTPGLIRAPGTYRILDGRGEVSVSVDGAGLRFRLRYEGMTVQYNPEVPHRDADWFIYPDPNGCVYIFYGEKRGLSIIAKKRDGGMSTSMTNPATDEQWREVLKTLPLGVRDNLPERLRRLARGKN